MENRRRDLRRLRRDLRRVWMMAGSGPCAVTLAPYQALPRVLNVCPIIHLLRLTPCVHDIGVPPLANCEPSAVSGRYVPDYDSLLSENTSTSRSIEGPRHSPVLLFPDVVAAQRSTEVLR